MSRCDCEAWEATYLYAQGYKIGSTCIDLMIVRRDQNLQYQTLQFSAMDAVRVTWFLDEMRQRYEDCEECQRGD
jgi:hypothetical protein